MSEPRKTMQDGDKTHVNGETPDARHERFLSLYTPVQRRIHALIMTLLPGAKDAEDVLQETTLVLWRKFSEFDPAQDFGNWAVGIARLEVYRYCRQRGRAALPLEQHALELLCAEHAAMSESIDHRWQALSECLRQLSTVDRDLVRRCYGGDVKFKDVAAALGRPVNSVYKSLSRIRAALMACVKHRTHEEGVA